MPATIQMILDGYIQKVKEIYGKALRSVILYGSYARGDYRLDSDIDIMILVTLDENEIYDSQKALFDMTYDFWWDYDVDINPIIKNEAHFLQWAENYPFYNNVCREGVRLYAA